jgi:hypothetical protein
LTCFDHGLVVLMKATGRLCFADGVVLCITKHLAEEGV